MKLGLWCARARWWLALALVPLGGSITIQHMQRERAGGRIELIFENDKLTDDVPKRKTNEGIRGGEPIQFRRRTSP